MEKLWIFGLAVALIIGGIISLFASSDPDGLERVAINLFGGEEQMEEKTTQIFNSPMPDYVIPGIENETLAASLAGVIGVLIIFAIVIVTGKILKGKQIQCAE
ncbi:conserved exported hypothetical protein [groundwater metagenome]|uniref:PDGLE domain-containing protein n=1 Tax=groundwater metagenome TaxID=717931 RepID=A0A098EDT9_9ZZZZ